MHYTSEYKKQRKGMQETDTLAYLLVVILFDPIKRKEKHSWFIKKKKQIMELINYETKKDTTYTKL